MVSLKIKFLVKLGKSGHEIMEMLVRVYGDNAVKKTAVCSGWNVFLREEKVSPTERDHDGPLQAAEKKILQKIRQIVRENLRLTVRSIAEEVNIDRETVRKLLTEDLDMSKCNEWYIVQDWAHNSKLCNFESRS
jgi:predicted transposase YdaD